MLFRLFVLVLGLWAVIHWAVHRKPRAPQHYTPPAVAGSEIPPGFPTESSIKEMIAAHDRFNGRGEIRIPTAFTRAAYEEVLRRYPALNPAVRNYLVVLEPSPDQAMSANQVIGVHLTSAGASTMSYRIEWPDFNGNGGAYVIDAGHRQLVRITNIQYQGGAWIVKFLWTYDAPVTAALIDGPGFQGSATLTNYRGWQIGVRIDG